VLTIRAADEQDRAAVWNMLEPVARAGEEFALPRDLSQADGVAYWFAAGHEVFVALDEAVIVGSYFIRRNQPGGGDHVANCGYMTSPAARGKGVARAMLEHSLQRARKKGFRAMQFNFVVSSNERAVKTWAAYGFEIVGRLPGAFRHPQQGDVDVFVMFRTL
jgi:GNAT superfamily N-acetyltransferase